MVKKIKVSIDGKDYLVEVDNIDSNPVRVIVNGDEIEVYTDQLESIDKKSIDEKPSSKTNTNISVNIAAIQIGEWFQDWLHENKAEYILFDLNTPKVILFILF